MPLRAIISRTLCSAVAVAVAAAALAACGGAESRKAKHLEKGEAFLAAGNYEKARVEFRNALQIAPNDSEARYENGVVAEKMGNVREAVKYFQVAIDTNADNVRARASLGRIFALSGAPDQALATIKPSIEKHPDEPDLLTVRAAARVQLKDTPGALADAEHAVQLAPANEDAVAVLAGIYRSLGENDKARNLLEAAIQKSPATVNLRLVLAQLYTSLNDRPKVEALLMDLVRVQPHEKAHRLRLAQFYAAQDQLDAAEKTLRDGIKDLPDERDLKVALVQFLGARRSREAAEKELNVLIAADPKDYELRFAQAKFYEDGKDIPKAEAGLKQVISEAGLEGPGITARDRLATLRVQQNDSDGAEKLIAEVLLKNPRDNDALILRGNLALAHKDPKSAIADLRSVLRDQPNSIGVMRVLARAHLENDEPALAEETIRHAVDANPRDLAVRLDLAELLLKLGKPEQAKPVIDELVKLKPDDLQALDVQFKVAAAAKDIAGAKAAADAMVAVQPKQALGYFYQARVAEFDKRNEDAVRLYSTVLDLEPGSVDALQGLIRVLVGQKRTVDALKRLDATIASQPDSAYAANIKGELLLELRRLPEADAAFKLAIQRSPKWWAPYQGLSITQTIEGSNDAAVATLQGGLAKSQTPGNLETALAALYEHLGKTDDAIEVYEKALRRDPTSDLAANNLAMLLITYRKDLPSLDRAKQLTVRFATSNNPAFLDTYGWVLYKHGETASAVAALQGSLAKQPESPTFLYHLGMAEAVAGQPEAARNNLTRALKSGQKFPWVDDAKATLDKLANAPATGATQPKS